MVISNKFLVIENDLGRDLSIQVLDKFSLVTKFARDTYGQHEYILDSKATDKHSKEFNWAVKQHE
jgi:TBC1 domain family member 15